MKHADVKEALDLADEEVSKESKRIRRIGGERGRRACRGLCVCRAVPRQG